MAARAHTAVVGLSLQATCGVRDHATLLAQGLERAGEPCSFHWLTRQQRSLHRSRAEVAAWTQRLRAELAEERPRAILLHYSVFSYSHRGIPVFVRPVVGALREARAPTVAFMHELVYPWRVGGARGFVWAATQRAMLGVAARASSSVVVTAEDRERWFSSRLWLPRREVRLAPVFSNLPAPRTAAVVVRADSSFATAASDTASSASGERPVLGLFGYSYESAAISLVLDALVELRASGGDEPRLRLLGAPGAASAAGAAWIAAARARGLEHVLAFSGALPAQELSDELAACDVLVVSDAAGPSSRKGSLAGSLASGTPVVAIDGPNTWPALREAHALRLVSPDAGVLARSLSELFADPGSRAELGARGRDFAAREMSLQHTVEVVLALLAATRGVGASG